MAFALVTYCGFVGLSHADAPVAATVQDTAQITSVEVAAIQGKSDSENVTSDKPISTTTHPEPIQQEKPEEARLIRVEDGKKKEIKFKEVLGPLVKNSAKTANEQTASVNEDVEDAVEKNIETKQDLKEEDAGALIGPEIQDLHKSEAKDKDNIVKPEVAEKAQREVGFNPDNLSYDLSDETANKVYAHAKVDVDIKAQISASEELYNQTKQGIAGLSKKIDAMIDGTDKALDGFDDDDSKYIKEDSFDTNNDAETMVYPSLSANGLIVNPSSYAPQTFNDTIHKAINPISQTQETLADAAKKVKDELDAERQESKDDMIVFNQDYTGQIKKMKHDEYNEAKFVLGREYRHLSEINVRLRVLKLKKKQFKDNIKMLREKCLIDQQKILNASKIVAQKGKELNKIKGETEEIEQYRVGIVDRFKQLYEALSKWSKCYKISAKHVVNARFIPVMEKDQQEVADYFAHFRDLAERITKSLGGYSVAVKQKNKEFSTLSKTMDKRVIVNMGKNITKYTARVNLFMRSLPDTVYRNLNGAKSDTERMVALRGCTHEWWRETSKQLLDWMTKLKVVVGNIQHDLNFMIEEETKSRENAILAEYAQRLYDIYSSSHSALGSDLELIKIGVASTMDVWQKEIDDAKAVAGKDGALISNAVDELGARISSIMAGLLTLEKDVRASTWINTEFYTMVYSLRGLFSDMQTEFSLSMSELEAKMEVQKERFLKKRKRDAYRSVIERTSIFLEKYNLFVNRKRKFIDEISSLNSKLDDGFGHPVGIMDVKARLSGDFERIVGKIKECVNMCESLGDVARIAGGKMATEEDIARFMRDIILVIEGLRSYVNNVTKMLSLVDDIARDQALRRSARDVKTRFDSDISSVDQDDIFIREEISKIESSGAKMDEAYDKSMVSLTGRLKGLRDRVADREKIIDDMKKRFEEDFAKLRAMRVPMTSLARKFEEFNRYKKYVEGEYTALARQYEDLEEAQVEDIHNMKTEELSLKTQRETTRAKIKTLQALVTHTLHQIITVVPTAGANSLDMPKGNVKGHIEAKKF